MDTHGPASAYIASESRVSWPDKSHYDCCRKTFYSESYPEILGYCGDVLFPSLIINSILTSIDKHLIFNDGDNPIIRFKKFKKILFQEFHKYPDNRKILSDSFEIIYINRDIHAAGYPKYYAFSIKWTRLKKFTSKVIEIPNTSGLLHVMGSGKAEFESNYESFQKGRNKNTTRNVYHCFTKTLKSVQTLTCGGPPQLVAVYRKPKSLGFSFGLIHKRKRYYLGLEIPRSIHLENIEWRNDNFEICLGFNKTRVPDAKSQPVFSSD